MKNQSKNSTKIVVITVLSITFIPLLEWVQPDLNWRPFGYQPNAQTKLSYGPITELRKKTLDIKFLCIVGQPGFEPGIHAV